MIASEVKSIIEKVEQLLAGDFGASLRALIVSLKYCGTMSEPKIGEFLENFDVQVSAGSLSNILTNSAPQFRTIIEHAAAITFYHQQSLVPVVQTLVCDDASQCASSRREFAQPQRARRACDGYLYHAGANIEEARHQCLRLSPRPPQWRLRDALTRTDHSPTG